MRNPQTKDYVKQLSSELGLTQEQIWDIVKSPYYYQTHIMREVADRWTNYIPTVRIFGVGMFYCSGFNRKKLKDYLTFHRNKQEKDGEEILST